MRIEIVDGGTAPMPESPRQFLLRWTGRNCKWLKKPSGEDINWGEVDTEIMQEINFMVQGSPLPNILYNITQQEK